jgi:hypothetical protein
MLTCTYVRLLKKSIKSSGFIWNLFVTSCNSEFIFVISCFSPLGCEEHKNSYQTLLDSFFEFSSEVCLSDAVETTNGISQSIKLLLSNETSSGGKPVLEFLGNCWSRYMSIENSFHRFQPKSPLNWGKYFFHEKDWFFIHSIYSTGPFDFHPYLISFCQTEHNRLISFWFRFELPGIAWVVIEKCVRWA